MLGRRDKLVRHGEEDGLFLLNVLAQKLREPGPLAAPQQSDYAQDEWLQAGGNTLATRVSGWQAPLAALGLLDAARRWRAALQAVRSAGLALPAPDYERLDVAALLARRR